MSQLCIEGTDVPAHRMTIEDARRFLELLRADLRRIPESDHVRHENARRTVERVEKAIGEA